MPYEGGFFPVVFGEGRSVKANSHRFRKKFLRSFKRGKTTLNGVIGATGFNGRNDEYKGCRFLGIRIDAFLSRGGGKEGHNLQGRAACTQKAIFARGKDILHDGFDSKGMALFI